MSSDEEIPEEVVTSPVVEEPEESIEPENVDSGPEEIVIDGEEHYDYDEEVEEEEEEEAEEDSDDISEEIEIDKDIERHDISPGQDVEEQLPFADAEGSQNSTANFIPIPLTEDINDLISIATLAAIELPQNPTPQDSTPPDTTPQTSIPHIASPYSPVSETSEIPNTVPDSAVSEIIVREDTIPEIVQESVALEAHAIPDGSTPQARAVSETAIALPVFPVTEQSTDVVDHEVSNEEVVPQEPTPPEIINEEVADEDVSQETPEQVLPQENLEVPPNVLKEKSTLSETDLDLSSISVFLQTDFESIQSIRPDILLKIQARINEISALQSDKLVLEVNLEQATHIGNKRAELIKDQLHKAQKENSELREKSLALESSKFEVQKKLSDLELEFKSKTSSDDHNRTRLESALSDNRKTVELIEKKNTEIESLRSDYNDIQESKAKLRKELITLETSIQTSNSTATQLKLKVQSSESQIDLLNKNNDWLNGELQKITVDFSEYRRQKSTEILSLQSELEATSAEASSLRSRYDALNNRFEEVSANLDNSLLEIKKLTDEKTLNKEEFFSEISVKDRLTNLLKQSNNDLKEKLDHLQAQLDDSKSGVATESASLKTTLDSYKLKLEQSESKIHQLEDTIEELTRSTPSENNSFFSAVPTLSPSAIATATKSNGISLSQLYSDFTLVKKQLVQERRAKERMQQQVDSFVSELERKAPLINATKERATILEKELTHLSVILENTTREKEELEKSKKSLAIELGESHSQTASLNKQKVDLARQVQNLLVQVTIRGDSYGPLTTAEQQALNRIASGDKVINESDTDKLISERLVVFQDIAELQKKNEELLRIIRDLGEKLEHQEQASRSRLEDLENAAVSEAKDAILTLNDEIESIESKLNAVTRERDMFRSMLAGKGSETSNVLGSNNIVNGEVTELSKKYEAAQTELTSLQTYFNQFKVESNTTIQLLNKQLDTISKEKSEFAVKLAREQSSGALVEKRYKSLQENLKLTRSETDELRKRSQLLQENSARQDIRTQQVAEELIQSRSLTESLRSETSNLKAEKQLWKSIEARLTQENSSLIEEKARLNSLLSNVQSLEREREANAVESQRRLILQTESLEKELASARERLVTYGDELKVIIAKKESDSYAYQDRIETLRSELSTTREDLIAKRGVVDSLEAKVESLTAKLASSEASLKDYRSASSSDGTQSVLVNETIKLRSELQEAKLELEEANNSVEKFKSIAASAEEAMNSISVSFDSYKENNNKTISKLESEVKRLEEQIAIREEQNGGLNNELLSTKAEATRKVELLRNQVAKLKEDAQQTTKLKEDYDLKIAAFEESYQQQANIATEAQKNYERELQKHIDVSKAVSSLREESNSLKLQVQQLSSESRAAKEELSQSQESWESQKNILDEELRIATDRVQDLTSQNHILYNQIDNLSKQVQRPEISSDDTLETTEDAGDDLRQLINLLRREKEISDTQLDVASRDLRRVRQQLDIANAELDRARLELVKSQKTDADVEKLANEHNQLLQEIQQLNLLRESNTTLRSDLQSNVAKVKDLQSKLVDAEAKVEPLETEVVQLKAEITHKGQEIRLVVEEKDRWKLRSQEILSKYDRIDPEEHERLKKEIAEVTKAKEEVEASRAELDVRFKTLKNEAQDKIKRRGVESKALQSQLNEATAELKKVQETSEDKVKELDAQIKELQAKLSASPDAGHEIESLKKDLETSKKEAEALSDDLKVKIAELTKAKEFETKFKESATLVNQLKSQVATLEKEVADLRDQLENVKATTSNGAANPSIAKLQEELAKEKAEFAKVKESFETEKAEFVKTKESFDKEKAELDSKSSSNSSDGVTNEKNKDVSLGELETKLRSEIEIEFNEKLELHKKKIRAPAEEKLQQIAEKRAATVKQEAEAEFKKKLEEFKKQNKGPQGLKKQYESKINELNDALQKAKKDSYEEGRQSTLKETGMRTKLLQGKLEKLTKEKKELEAKLNSTTATTTTGPSADTTPQNVTAVPAVASTPEKKKVDLPPKPTLGKPVEVKSDVIVGTKRPSDESDAVRSPEKKQKSDS